MRNSWGEERESWLRKTSLPDELSTWAIESINKNEDDIHSIERSASADTSIKKPITVEEDLKTLRKNIKNEIARKEDSIDDLSLITANSYKLQLSVPSNLNYLLKAWAAAEGRDLSSVAFQCLEIGLREMKSKGAIPFAAVKRYDNACEKRIALAEANNTWERYENELTKNLNKTS